MGESSELWYMQYVHHHYDSTFHKKRLFNTINLARWTDLLFARSKAKKRSRNAKKNKKGENLVRKCVTWTKIKQF